MPLSVDVSLSMDGRLVYSLCVLTESSMLLTNKPSTVLTHEQNILWSVSEILKTLTNQPENTVAPLKLTESEGYYPSDVIGITPIQTKDGGSRHIIRLLVPVDPEYYGSPLPVWNFAGAMALGLDTAIGMGGIVVPGRTEKVRFNPSVTRGTIQRFNSTTNTWGNDYGTYIDQAYLLPNGEIWTSLDSEYNTYHHVLPDVWVWINDTQSAFNAAIATPGTVKL